MRRPQFLSLGTCVASSDLIVVNTESLSGIIKMRAIGHQPGGRMRNMFWVWTILATAALIAFPVRSDDVEEQIEKYFDLAKSGKDDAAAKKLGDSILKAEKDASMLNEFAWKILTEEGIARRDLDLAMRVAKAAHDACEGKEAAIVDTYARALFETGKLAEAVKFQKKAVELCQDDGIRADLEEAQKRYEKKAAEK
jgi:hypothetical protein